MGLRPEPVGSELTPGSVKIKLKCHRELLGVWYRECGNSVRLKEKHRNVLFPLSTPWRHVIGLLHGHGGLGSKVKAALGWC